MAAWHFGSAGAACKKTNRLLLKAIPHASSIWMPRITEAFQYTKQAPHCLSKIICNFNKIRQTCTVIRNCVKKHRVLETAWSHNAANGARQLGKSVSIRQYGVPRSPVRALSSSPQPQQDVFPCGIRCFSVKRFRLSSAWLLPARGLLPENFFPTGNRRIILTHLLFSTALLRFLLRLDGHFRLPFLILTKRHPLCGCGSR